MSAAWQYYIITLLVFTGANLIAGWSLNLQFGLGGILNFGFIIFQGIGGYVAAVLALGPASASGGYQRYILGAMLPWPLPLVAGAVVGWARPALWLLALLLVVILSALWAVAVRGFLLVGAWGEAPSRAD